MQSHEVVFTADEGPVFWLLHMNKDCLALITYPFISTIEILYFACFLIFVLYFRSMVL